MKIDLERCVQFDCQHCCNKYTIGKNATLAFCYLRYRESIENGTYGKTNNKEVPEKCPYILEYTVETQD
jgi:hypothetical protein